MRCFGTLVRTSLASVLLAGLCSVAPASAGPTTTTTWETYANCSNANGIDGSPNGGCVGDQAPYPTTPTSPSGRAVGNEYKFSQSSGTAGTLYSAAYTLAHFTAATGNPNFPDESQGLKSDFLGYYSGYGLGVENQQPPDHSVDNNKYTDFVVFELPYAVNTIDITLSPFGTTENMDVTVFWGTPTGALLTQLGGDAGGAGNTGQGAKDFSTVTVGELTEYGFNEASTSTSPYTELFDETGNATIEVDAPTTATYVIVAATLTPASQGATDSSGHKITTNYEVDDFKINTIVGTYNKKPPSTCKLVYTGHSTPCPEPASFAMFGVGILGLGMAYRRRKTVRAA